MARIWSVLYCAIPACWYEVLGYTCGVKTLRTVRSYTCTSYVDVDADAIDGDGIDAYVWCCLPMLKWLMMLVIDGMIDEDVDVACDHGPLDEHPLDLLLSKLLL